MLDLRELKTFRTVATEKSFTRAASLLHYAQSSVTAQIHSLEEELAVPLFDRMGRRVELTLAGRQLLTYADKLLDMADEAKRAVQNDGQPAGTLTVGAPETLLAYRMPELLKRFQAQYPAIHLSLTASESCEIGPGGTIIAPNVDIAFTLDVPLRSTHLKIECLRPEPIVLAVSPQHPLAGKKKVKAEAIAQQQVLLTDRACSYRALFERTLIGEGAPLGASLEFLSVEAIKQCALATMGIAVLPEVVIANELKRGTLVPVDWPRKPLLVFTQMFRHQDKWMSPVMCAFWNLTSSLLQGEPGKKS
ncbi:LysR family transcriptional regulator [Granulicella sp. S156]|jgi:DNA-binding transcriptional LysR family regulator|uniref:LysR family transcriptional regulator n=1 Tax=Granulicella sp. S156 TaxID=1747224 RepID=UPI00131ADDCA|nr:LysR family transcriptional regulator [Granulicella sp. S156]